MNKLSMKAVCAASCLLLTAMASCSSDIESPISPAKEQEKGMFSVFGGVQEAKVQRSAAREFNIGDFSTPTLKTSLEHSQIKAASNPFFWEKEDALWVKKTDGTYVSSTKSDLVGKSASAKFYFTGLYEDPTYSVFYTGGDAGDKVTIASTQTQSAPNNTQHIGKSGDCGYAIAARNTSGIYEFSLQHKAAYVCVSPRMTDAALGKNIVLKKVKLTSANTNIAGTFDFSTGDLDLQNPTSASKTIEITAGDKGFPLTGTTSATALTNSSVYAVIAPGTHTITVEYTIFDETTNFTGTIVQELPQHNFEVNTVTDIVKDLNTAIYDLDAQKFYLWDAKNSYWEGETGTIPRWESDPKNDNYPKNESDPRFTNKSTTPANTAVNLPNVNELMWLAQRGDPHYELSSQIIFKSGGHINQGAGLWVKKKSQIEGYSTTAAPDGTDFSKKNPSLTLSIQEGRPTGDINNYFFLPAYGFYYEGKVTEQVTNGLYFSNYRPGQTIVSFYFEKPNKLFLTTVTDVASSTLWTVQ